MGFTTIAFALAAMLYGLDKSLAPGAGLLAVALLGGILPAKEATGLTLVMAIVADWSAIWAYRGHVSRASLLRLLPFVALGVLCGAGFLFVADDTSTKHVVGVILAIFIGVYFVTLLRDWVRNRRLKGAAPVSSHDDSEGNDAPGEARATPLAWGKRLICGVLAGFTTMVANCGGPVTSIFFLSEGLSVMRFLGTTAVFYLIVNLVKLPFAIGLSMITVQGLLVMWWSLPITVCSVLVGRFAAKHVNRQVFSTIVYVLAVAAVIRLLVG